MITAEHHRPPVELPFAIEEGEKLFGAVAIGDIALYFSQEALP